MYRTRDHARVIVPFGLAVVLGFSPAMLAGCQATRERPAPPAATSYVLIPFKKLINPAFTDEVENKWVQCKVRFQTVMDTMTDLPPEYRTAFVRFSVQDVDDLTAIFTDVVIPKAKSDLVFKLTMGDKIDLFTFAQSVVRTNTLTGVKQRGIVLVVESLAQSQ